MSKRFRRSRAPSRSPTKKRSKSSSKSSSKSKKKFYCGNKKRTPKKYSRMGTRYECMKKGFGVGSYIQREEMIQHLKDLGYRIRKDKF
jgi:hypothetical protein